MDWLTSTEPRQKVARIKDNFLTAEALLLTCMDFRFQEAYTQIMKELDLADQYDQVSIAGASLNLSDLSNENNKMVVIDQIKLALDLHFVKKVIIVDHENCGAYSLALENMANDPHSEKEIHFYYLKNARTLLQTLFKGLLVELYYLTLDGQFEKIP